MPALARLLRLAPTAHQLYVDSSPRDDRDLLLEEQFFAALRLPNGVFKSTAHGRFDDVNRWLDDFLPETRPLQLMDVAISSGITTHDWMLHLEARGIDSRMTASDLCLNSWLISLGPIRVLIDSKNYPLQYDLFGQGLRTASGNPVIDLPFMAVRLLVRTMLALGAVGQPLTSVPPSATPHAPTSTTRRGLFRVRHIPLVTGSLLEETTAGSTLERATLIEEDLLDGTPPDRRERFHLLRAANILNRGYFDELTLTRLVQTLRDRLSDNGRLLIIHSRESGGNHASLFERSRNGLKLVARFGEGCEVESLASRAGEPAAPVADS